jgi:hypothetical protein
MCLKTSDVILQRFSSHFECLYAEPLFHSKCSLLGVPVQANEVSKKIKVQRHEFTIENSLGYKN